MSDRRYEQYTVTTYSCLGCGAENIPESDLNGERHAKQLENGDLDFCGPIVTITEKRTPIIDRRDSVGDAEEASIEVQGPDGVKNIPMRANWTLRDVTRIRQLMEAAGYEQTAPTSDPSTGALFAYAPKVHADELGDTPFDTEAQSLCERLSLIPGTRAHSLKKTPTGLSGRLTDYGSGRTLDVRLDEVQPELSAVPTPTENQ